MDTGQYQTAKLELETIVAEHNIWLTELGNLKDGMVYGEQIMMNHALNHLNAVIDHNDPSFMDNGVLKHQSDIVKEGLLREPKQDYSSDD